MNGKDIDVSTINDKDMIVFSVKCKKEAISSNGEFIMKFTKGKEYTTVFYDDKLEGEWYEVRDDKGDKQCFFDINIMFEKI